MNALNATANASATRSSFGGSVSSFLQGLHDRILGPKLNPDDPPAPIDRDFEVQPHVVQWPPPSDTTPTDSDTSGSSAPSPTVPQGAVPCSSIMDPSPTSGDPIVCSVKNDDPNADQQLIYCDKEVNVDGQGYCVPSR